MNNFSLFTADRTTHLKIVVIAGICVMVVSAISVAGRLNQGPADPVEATVVKAGKPVTASFDQHNTIR